MANTRQAHKTNVMVPKMHENASKAGIFIVTKTRFWGFTVLTVTQSEMETFH
jgi:hypothetical protein